MEEMYRGYLIEKYEHPKIRSYFGIYSNEGKHVWNCNTKKEAKKLINMIIDEGYNPFDWSNKHVLNE